MKDSTSLQSQVYDPDMTYRIIDVGWVSGSPVESGSNWAWVAATVSVEEHFTDGTKSWTTDQWAGKWLYIRTADAGQGIVGQIESNTSNTLYLINGFVALPAGVTQYYIFDKYTTIFGYNMPDWVYLSHADSNLMQWKINNITIATNMGTAGWRIFWYTEQWNIYATNPGLNNLTLNGNNFYVGTQAWILDFVDYKEYMVLLSLDSIDLIKTQTITISTGTGSAAWSGTIQETAFKIVNATKQFGEHNRWAYVVYNQGLYMVTRRGKFVALNIAPVSSTSWNIALDEFTVTQQDQWVNIQRHLDPYRFTATYRLSIDDDEINIVQNDDSMDFTRIFKYDFSYQGWHYWETTLPINYVLNRSLGYSYVGDNIYEPDVNLAQDIGSVLYDQLVQMVVHEDTVFSVKQDVYLKLYLGHRTTQECLARFTYNLSGDVSSLSKAFTDIEYLNQVNLLWLWGQNDNPILVYGTRWAMDVQTSEVSWTSLAEIPLGFNCELLTISLEANWLEELHLGWALLGYNLMWPELTSKKNTV